MKVIRIGIILFTALCMLSTCDYSKYPSWPQEDVFTYDTVDCSGLCCVPTGAITVHKAVEIGKQLTSGQSTDEMYYIKGIVKGFNSKHESAMTEHHNGCFYIQDNTHTNVDFYCYQTLALNGAPFDSLAQLKVGDFVVVYSKISNYNGTIETTSKGSSYLVCSTNDLLYPETDVDYFTELFTNGIGDWTQKVVTDPGFTVWNHNTTARGVTSMIAQAVNGSKQNVASEVWLVSPAIDLAKHKPGSLKLAFQTYYQKGTVSGTAPNVQDYLRLKVSTDGTRWDDITIPNFNSGSMAIYTSDTIDISAYVSAQTRIAFSYTSTEAFAPKWSVNNIHICEHKRARVCN